MQPCRRVTSCGVSICRHPSRILPCSIRHDLGRTFASPRFHDGGEGMKPLRSRPSLRSWVRTLCVFLPCRALQTRHAEVLQNKCQVRTVLPATLSGG